MRRSANGPDAMETINAAASAIVSGETRGNHTSTQVLEMKVSFPVQFFVFCVFLLVFDCGDLRVFCAGIDFE